MANIIDSTYFTRELHLANKGQSEVVTEIAAYIAKYEPDYLDELLGPTLASEFIAGLAVGAPEAKWTDLRDKLANATLKISPIANYVYTFIQQAKTTTTAGTSETKAKNENSYPASSVDKEVRAWNEMKTLSDKVYEWVQARPVDYVGLSDKGCKVIFKYRNTLGF